MLQKLTHNVINIHVKRPQRFPADFNITHTTGRLLQAGVGLSIKIMGDIHEISGKTSHCELSCLTHTCRMKAGC